MEYKKSVQSGRTRAQGPVCDLIPLRVARQYRAGDTVCLELSAPHESPPAPTHPPLPATVNMDLSPCIEKQVDTAQVGDF